MVDFNSLEVSFRIRAIQAVSLRQEMFQRAARGMKRLSLAVISPAQHSGRCASIFSFARVRNPSASLFAAHTREKIRQLKPFPPNRHGQPARGIKAEEPHPGLFAMLHIRPNIQFRKTRGPRNRRRISQPHSLHAKRNHAQPRLALIRVNLQLARHVWPQPFLLNAPVRKQQVMPPLFHYRGTTGQRPRAVRNFVEDVFHDFFALYCNSLLEYTFTEAQRIESIAFEPVKNFEGGLFHGT